MRRIAVVVAATAALALGAPTAFAAPPAEPEPLELNCDDGETYVVVVNPGHGAFTPAEVVGTNQWFIPISFDDFHFTATSPEGEILAEGSEPDERPKGSVGAHSPRPALTCTADQTFVLEEPDFGLPAGTTITESFVLTGFLTGR